MAEVVLGHLGTKNVLDKIKIRATHYCILLVYTHLSHQNCVNGERGFYLALNYAQKPFP